ncbi:MAG: AAA family ATPase [Actinomycetota bacterium]
MIPTVGEQGGVRRHLPLLVVDVVGSTALAARSSADLMQYLASEIAEIVKASVESWGGQFLKSTGDGAWVTFGPDSEPLHAIESGLEFLESFARARGRLARMTGERLDVRVVAHWGEVAQAAGSDTITPGDVFGLAANVVAKMEKAAPAANALIISEDLRRRIGDEYQVEPLGDHLIDGLPVAVNLYRVVAGGRPAPDFSARLPLRGRESERRSLRASWAAVQLVGSALVISGEAGIGKSRLLSEAGAIVEADGVPWLRMRCRRSRRGRALAPLADIVHQLGELGSGAAAVGETAPAQTRSIGASFAELCASMGVAIDPESDRSVLREASLQGVVDRLEGAAVTGPLLLSLDDMQWADPTTLELVDRVIEACARSPIWFIATSRIAELPDTVITSLDRGNATLLELGPLTDAAAADLLEDVVSEQLEPDVVAEVVRRGGGSPYFTEEIAREIQVDGIRSMLRIPATLSGQLNARATRLPARARRCAVVIAALDHEATPDLLADVWAEYHGSEPVDLVPYGLLGDDRSETLEFRHDLVREALLDSALEHERADVHAAIGRTITASHPAIRKERPEVPAYHLSRSADRTLWPEAAELWLDAGHLQLASSSHAEALTHFTNGLELLRDRDLRQPRTEVDLLLGQATCLVAVGGYTSRPAEEAYGDIAVRLSKASSLDSRSVMAAWGTWAYYLVRGRLDRAADVLAQMTPEREADLDRDDLLFLASVRGADAMYRGELERSRSELTLAVALRPEDTMAISGTQEPGLACRSYLPLVLWLQGRVEDAARAAAEADATATDFVELSKRSGDGRGLFMRAAVDAHLAWYHQVSGDPAKALAAAQQSLEAATTGGFLQWQAAAALHLGIALCSLGEREQGLPIVETTLEQWVGAGAGLLEPYFRGHLARAHLANGDVDAARDAADRAVGSADESGEVVLLPDHLLLSAELAAGAGDRKGSIAGLERALEVAEQQGAPGFAARAANALVERRGSDLDRHRAARAARRLAEVAGRSEATSPALSMEERGG